MNLGDITKINVEDIKFDIDLLTHGSPCQSFSSAGKQEGGDEGSGTKSSLLWYSVNIIKHKKPKYIVWENVKNVLSAKHKHNFDKYIETLSEYGYNSYYQIFNSKDYGIPQNRERIFVISIRKDVDNSEYRLPKPFKLQKSISDIVDKTVDEKYIVPYQNMYNFCTRNETWSKRVKIKKLSDYANCLVAKSGRACRTNNYIFNNFNEYSDCKFEMNNVLNIINSGIKLRALTPLEYFRLQGFYDEDFNKAKDIGMSDAQLYKQAGNSITVDIPYYIFKELLKDYI